MTTEQEAFTPLQWFQTLYSTLNQDDDFFVLYILLSFGLSTWLKEFSYKTDDRQI